MIEPIALETMYLMTTDSGVLEGETGLEMIAIANMIGDIDREEKILGTDTLVVLETIIIIVKNQAIQ